MAYAERLESIESENEADLAARKSRGDRIILRELIALLSAHPGGLRRWSVMRAIREERERAQRDVPQKFEDEVERTFRRFCADFVDAKIRPRAESDSLFFRPRERAGEVWAVFPKRAEAWLASESAEVE